MNSYTNTRFSVISGRHDSFERESRDSFEQELTVKYRLVQMYEAALEVDAQHIDTLCNYALLCRDALNVSLLLSLLLSPPLSPSWSLSSSLSLTCSGSRRSIFLSSSPSITLPLPRCVRSTCVSICVCVFVSLHEV